jgi:integrase
LLSYVSRNLTIKSGVTMRALRNVRIAWAWMEGLELLEHANSNHEVPRIESVARSGFRERAWLPAVGDAAEHNARFAGFRFHWLRHTAGSLMASFGMDPATAAERLGHSDGGALFLRTYRHLYEDERRRQADLFGARVQEQLDEEWTEEDEAESDSPLNEADEDDGRTWDRTRDLPRVKRALSR